MSEGKEVILYERGDVIVTNARFIVPSQTFAMSGITSVRFSTDKPSLLWPIVCVLVALVALGYYGSGWSFGIPLFAGFLLLLRKTTHHVVLSSSSGETRALNSEDKEFIAGVIHALNRAIVSRG